jgi:hypothetical protein
MVALEKEFKCANMRITDYGKKFDMQKEVFWLVFSLLKATILIYKKVAKDLKMIVSFLYMFWKKKSPLADATIQRQKCMCIQLKKVHSKILLLPCL